MIAGRARLNAITSTQYEAALWTNGGTQYLSLGVLPGSSWSTNPVSVATAVSNDGSVVYGYGTSSQSGKVEAFRWTAASGMVGLGFGSRTTDYRTIIPHGAVSADGSVAVGYSMNNTDYLYIAMRYTTLGGMSFLGPLTGGTWSEALAVSADGKVVLGRGDTANGISLFLWTETQGFTLLGGGETISGLGGLNADGSIAVSGGSLFNFAGQSFVEAILIASGMDITGWSSFSANGISDNGQTLWGTALNPQGSYEGWIATFPENYLSTIQAVPEPGVTTLLVIGTAGLLLASRRRTRQS